MAFDKVVNFFIQLIDLILVKDSVLTIDEGAHQSSIRVGVLLWGSGLLHHELFGLLWVELQLTQSLIGDRLLTGLSHLGPLVDELLELSTMLHSLLMDFVFLHLIKVRSLLELV